MAFLISEHDIYLWILTDRVDVSNSILTQRWGNSKARLSKQIRCILPKKMDLQIKTRYLTTHLEPNITGKSIKLNDDTENSEALCTEITKPNYVLYLNVYAGRVAQSV
jgi:hypothetical protein